MVCQKLTWEIVGLLENVMTFVKLTQMSDLAPGLILPNPGLVTQAVENPKKLLVEAGEEPVVAGIMEHVPAQVIILLVLLAGRLRKQPAVLAGEFVQVGLMGHAVVFITVILVVLPMHRQILTLVQLQLQVVVLAIPGIEEPVPVGLLVGQGHPGMGVIV